MLFNVKSTDTVGTIARKKVKKVKKKRSIVDVPKAKKQWTEDEEIFLQEKWGNMTIPGIAKKLGRSENAVIVRAQRMGLGAHLESDHRISYHQLIVELYGKNQGSYTESRLIRAGIPVKLHKVKNSRFRVIDIEEFWKWAENHKDILDFSRLEPYALGAEPEWVKLKRKLDCDKKRKTKKNHNDPWTQSDDAKLQRMVAKGIYTYTDIAGELRKTEGAVKRRIYDLGIQGKPKKNKPRKWSNKEVETLIHMKEQGYDWMHIAEELQRSALSVRGKYERLQNPEYMKRYYRGDNRYKYTGIHDITPKQMLENAKRLKMNDQRNQGKQIRKGRNDR